MERLLPQTALKNKATSGGAYENFMRVKDWCCCPKFSNVGSLFPSWNSQMKHWLASFCRSLQDWLLHQSPTWRQRFVATFIWEWCLWPGPLLSFLEAPSMPPFRVTLTSYWFPFPPHRPSHFIFYISSAVTPSLPTHTLVSIKSHITQPLFRSTRHQMYWWGFS